MHRSTGLCSVWLHLTTLIYALVPAARHRDILIILTAILKKNGAALQPKNSIKLTNFFDQQDKDKL